MKKPNITEGEWDLILEHGKPIIGVRQGQIVIPVIINIPLSTEQQRCNSLAISAVPDMIDALINSYRDVTIALANQEPIPTKVLIQWADELEQALKKAGCHE